MSKRLLFITILMFLPLLSCIPTSHDIQVVADSQKVLAASMVELKTAVKESKVVDQAKADKFFTEAERVLEQSEEVLEAMEGKEGLEMVRDGVAATSGWNPYAAPILLGITILETLGLFGLGKKNKTQGEALTEIVAGVEGAGAKTPVLKASLVNNTSTRTKALINSIKRRAA